MADYEPSSDWRERIAADMRDILSRVTGDVLRDAQAACPVDTGHLRESLRSATEGTVGRVGTDLNYGLYVEEGHRIAYRGADGETHYTGGVVAPQPYLRPALYKKRSI